LQETFIIDRSKYWYRVKELKKVYEANGYPKQVEVAIFIKYTSNVN
jgi:hypothetical protein